MPEYYSEEELCRLLEIDFVAAKVDHSASFAAQGMGYWSRYQSIMQRRKNAIQRLEAISIQKKKPKIILCDSLASAPDAKDLGLMSALMNYFEVYPWTGKLDRSFTDSSELWKKRSAIQCADSATVQDELPKLNLAASDFIVIDLAKYCAMLKQTQLDLTSMPVSDECPLKTILKRYKKLPIKSIKLYAPAIEEIQLLNELYPEAELEILNANQNWLKMCEEWEEVNKQSLFAGRSLFFTNYRSEEFIADLSARKLKINNAEKLNLLFFVTRNSELESVSLERCPRLEAETFFLANAVRLRKYDFENIYASENEEERDVNKRRQMEFTRRRLLEFSKEIADRYLSDKPYSSNAIADAKEYEFWHIDEASSVGNQIWALSHAYEKVGGRTKKVKNKNPLTAEKFVIDFDEKDSQLEEVEFCVFKQQPPVLKKLKKLTYKNAYYPRFHIVFDADYFPMLETLVLMGSIDSLTDCHNISSLENLKELTLGKECIQVSLSLPQSLEKFTSDSAYLLELKFAENAKLRTLDVSDFRPLQLDLSTCPDLDKLVIDDACKLTELILPSASKITLLTIKKCKQLKPINLALLPSLREVTLGSVEELKQWNIAECETLKTLILLNPVPDEKESIKLGKAEDVMLSWFKDPKESKEDECSIPPETLAFKNPRFKSLLVMNQVSEGINKVDISHAQHLETLALDWCANLTELKLTDCPKLKLLSINGTSLTYFPEAPLDSLEELFITNCALLEKIDFTRLPNLKRLTIHNCKQLNSECLSNLILPKLEMLSIKDALIEPREKKINLNLMQCVNLKAFSAERIWCFNEIKLAGEVEKVKFNNVFGTVIFAAANKLKEAVMCDVDGAALTRAEFPSLVKLSVQSPTRHLSIQLDGNKFPNIQNLEVMSVFSFNQISNLHVCKQLRSARVITEHSQDITLPASCIAADVFSFEDVKEARSAYLDEKKSSDSTEAAQQIKNHLSPVSCLSFNDPDKLRIKVPDGKVKDTKSSGSIRVTLIKKGGVDKRLYRCHIRDQFIATDTTVDFKAAPIQENPATTESRVWQTYTDADYSRLEQAVLMQGTHALGCFQGEIVSGKQYPLAADQPMEFDAKLDFYCNPPTKLKRIWDAEKQQYFIELDEKRASTANVKVLYFFACNRIYSEPPKAAQKIVQSAEVKFSESFRDKIITKIQEESAKNKGVHGLDFLNVKEMDLEEKVQHLVDYCKGFDWKKDIKKKSSDETENMANIIAQAAGACEPRSQAFITLANMLGVTARYLEAEQHAFVEVLYYSADGRRKVWHRYDLDGGEMRDYTPAANRVHPRDEMSAAPTPIFAQPDAKETKRPAAALFAPETKRPIFKTALVEAQMKEKKILEDEIRSYYTELTQCKKFESITQLSEYKFLKHPLIRLSPEQDPYDINKLFITELKKQPGVDYLFINSPNDFEDYLNPPRISDGVRTIVKDSPLGKLIKVDGATLVVNWNNFSVNEIATYKSILDDKPTLDIHEVTGKLKIYGLIDRKKTQYQALTSRGQPAELLSDCFKSLKEKSPDEKDEKIVRKILPPIYLFNRINWHEAVLGTVIPDGKIEILIPGPLIEAILSRAENQTFILYDPPDSEELNTLIRRIRDEKVIYYNGGWHPVPKGFEIQTKKAERINSLPNVHWIRHDEKINPDNLIELTLDDLHRFYEETSADKDGNPFVEPGGLLKKVGAGKVFYFINPIPSDQWHALLHHIQKNFKGKDFYFKCAPGMMVQGVPESKGPPLLAPKPTRPDMTDKVDLPVVVTNDPDFMCSQLQSELKVKTKVVHVTAKDDIGTLFVSRAPNVDKQVKLKIKSLPLLDALMAGENIILTGNISLNFYRQLLPLLSGSPPHIDYNNERHLIKEPGRLRLVISNEQSQTLTPQDACVCNYELADYLAAFPNDQENVKLIYRYIQTAQKLPHSGIGMPAPPVLSYENMKAKIHILRKKEEKLQFHQHNPVKPVFLRKYPSEHYAYLNVMGKIIFRPADNSPARREKLEKLTKYLLTDEDYKKNIWKLLNYFNGKQLIKDLHLDLRESIEHDGFPHLSPTAFAAFRKLIATTLSQKEEKASPKIPHMQKREQELYAYLNDENCFIITLLGLAGVGKTEMETKLNEDKKHYTVYSGDSKKQLFEWLNNKDEKIKILFIDELNTALPDEYNFLKDLQRGLIDGKIREITVDGITYPVTDKHKIIATGNPVSYAERYHHDIMETYSRTIYFKMPGDKSLASIIKEKAPKLNDDICTVLISAFHLARQLNPTYTYSLRDLISTAIRIAALAKDPTSIPAAFFASKIEYLGTFYDDVARAQFVKQLAERYEQPIESAPASNAVITVWPRGGTPFYYPAARKHIVEAIKEDLNLRDAIINNPIGRYKTMVLLEGKPGLGKSTLFENILLERGYTKTAADTQKRYYMITQNEQGSAKEIILQAYRDGSVVILDEVNVNSETEKLINAIMKDAVKTDDGVKVEPNKRGFMLLASQNPSSIEGIKATAASLLNRGHVLQMPENTPEELRAVAKASGEPDPELLVNIHNEFEKSAPSDTIARTFFSVMKRHIADVNARSLPKPQRARNLLKSVLKDVDYEHWPLPKEESQLFECIKSRAGMHAFILDCNKEDKLTLMKLKQYLFRDEKDEFSATLRTICDPGFLAQAIMSLPRERDARNKDTRVKSVTEILTAYKPEFAARSRLQIKIQIENFYRVILRLCIQRHGESDVSKMFNKVLLVLEGKSNRVGILQEAYIKLIEIFESGKQAADQKKELIDYLQEMHEKIRNSKHGSGSRLGKRLGNLLKSSEFKISADVLDSKIQARHG